MLIRSRKKEDAVMWKNNRNQIKQLLKTALAMLCVGSHTIFPPTSQAFLALSIKLRNRDESKSISPYKIPSSVFDKSRARKEGGAGIGMALCQKIIQLHHAEWSIRSRTGEGTEIEIRFFHPKQEKGGSLKLSFSLI